AGWSVQEERLHLCRDLGRVEVKLYLSGGLFNDAPEQSLGGEMSQTEADPATLFGEIPGVRFASGTVRYRCIYVHALTDQQNLVAYVKTETPSDATTVALAWGAPVDTFETDFSHE